MTIIEEAIPTPTPEIGNTIRCIGRQLVVIGEHGTHCLALDQERGCITAVDPHNTSWIDTTTEMNALVQTLGTAAFDAQNRLQNAQMAVAEHEQLMQDIREYAIARHLDGDFCREGLNQALAHFDLDPYNPRHTIRVNVTATFGINAVTEEDALQRVRFLIDGVAYSGHSDEENLDVELDSIHVEAS